MYDNMVTIYDKINQAYAIWFIDIEMLSFK